MRRSVPLLAICTLLLSACGEAAPSPTPIPPTPTTVPTTVPTAVPTATLAPPTAIPSPTTPPALSNEEIVDKLRPATVLVLAQFAETAIDTEGVGEGTGIVYDAKNGYVLTNAHVVEGASIIKVASANSTKARSARVLGRAQCDDLAVLKVDDTEGLVAAPLGDTNSAKVGSDVVALGYPEAFDLGTDLSATTGTVSKLHAQQGQYEDLIQTNAAITHGNSGGPLVNRKGEVIGINTLGFYTAKGEREPNINFAIAMSHARPIIKDLESGKNRQYTGLNLYPNAFADYFGTDLGMVIIGVASGSPAAQVGLQPADLLLKIEGTSITGDVDVCDILHSHADGDQIKVTVLRADTGKILEGELTIGKIGAADDKTPKLAQVGTLDTTGGTGSNGGGNSGGGSSGGGGQGGTGTGSSSDKVDIVLSSKFDNGDPGPWEVGNQKGFSAGVVDGRYALLINAESLPVISTPNGDAAADLTDGLIGADIQLQGNGIAGLVARDSQSGNSSSAYVCWFSNDKKFGCYKSVNGTTTDVVKEATSASIAPNKANSVSLIMLGNELSFYINNDRVAQVTDNSIQQGSWGLFASTLPGVKSSKAYFDEIVIAKPK